MQTVSQSWINNQRQTIVNESFVEVSLDIADPEALADASSEDNGAVYISNTQQVVSEVDRNIVPYSTLEQNLWVLDGTRKFIPQSDFGDCGYIGNTISDGSCTFSDETPIVTVNFTKTHNNLIPAVTITWGTAYNEFAEDFIVTAWNGDSVVAQKEVVGNTSVRSVVEFDIIGYDRITVTILRWCLPYRRPRIEEIFVGMNKVYTKAELFGYKHTQTADPTSSALPKAEVSFSVDNIDNTYNPHNLDGLSKYLMERQEVKTRYGFKVNDETTEWIKGGTFYLSEWDAPQNGMTAEFKARDLLEFMSTMFYEGVYNPDGTDLYSLALQVLQKANLPLNSDGTIKWIIDESLKNIYTVAPLPIDTLSNCLQLIANAGGCVLYQDRNGTLRIERIGSVVSDYSITHENSYSKSDTMLSKPLKNVEVVAYQYFDGDNTELYKGVLTVNGTIEVILTYSEMARNVVATINGGTLVSSEFYTNACKLTLSGNGSVEVILTGDSLKESGTNVVTEVGKDGEVVSLDNPLITSYDRAIVIGAWVADYLRSRITLKSSYRADPRLDVLDVVENVNNYNTNRVRITNVEYDYNGSFKGSVEGRVI